MEVNWATPLYEFLRRCNAEPVPKTVLDCGAGGSQPPLSIFYKSGYFTAGIEIASGPLLEAQEYCYKNNMRLNIIGGDMRWIPFADESFSFVYTFNAIDFLSKQGIEIAISEITRVLKSGGLFYVNFLSVDDQETWDPFNELGQKLFNNPAFSHFEDNEADAYFEEYQIQRKEKRLTDKLWQGKLTKRAEIEYILKKNKNLSGMSCMEVFGVVFAL
jgi:ubiquinone/menaquinone biosynthesis C-methylase UbiE